MGNPYDIRSWSRLCREDALREAQERHLVEQAEAECGQRFGRSRVSLACRNALLPLLRKTRPVG